MRPLLQVEVGFLVAACAAMALTPLAMRFARSVGAIDKPGGRHGHCMPALYIPACLLSDRNI